MAATVHPPQLTFSYCRPDGTSTLPNPSQSLAHGSDAYEVLFGGEVFGGKTDFLIAEALITALEVPGALVAFGRSALKDLTGTVLQRFRELTPRVDGQPVFTWNGSKHRFECVLPEHGSVIQFIYCDHPDDVQHYWSDQWILLCFDQIENLSEAQYLFLLQRVRSRFPGVPAKVRVTSNPHGGWIKRRFVVPANEDLAGRSLPARNEMWVPHSTVTPDSPQGVTRQFISAAASENVEGRRADPLYFVHLAGTQTARELERLRGNWDVWAGQLFAVWAACSQCGRRVTSSRKRTKSDSAGICRSANGLTGM